MAFADTMAANFYAYLAKHFAEAVTIGGAPGVEPRTVWGIVHATAGEVDGQRVENNLDTLLFRCGRDESHELGGIARPAFGLTLTLAGEDDLPAYAYSGKTSERTAWSHVLEFVRAKPKRLNPRGAV